MLAFPSNVTDALCADPSNTFNFAESSKPNVNFFESTVALTSVYLYGSKFNTANANYWDTFLSLTKWSAFQITQKIHSPTSSVTLFF